MGVIGLIISCQGLTGWMAQPIYSIRSQCQNQLLILNKIKKNYNQAIFLYEILGKICNHILESKVKVGED